MIPNSWKIFHPSSSNENNGVFLEVMANPWNISGYLDPVGQSHPSDFSKSGIRFLGSGCINSNTNPPFLRGSRKSRGGSLALDASPSFSNHLINCRHSLPLLTKTLLFQQVKNQHVVNEKLSKNLIYLSDFSLFVNIFLRFFPGFTKNLDIYGDRERRTESLISKPGFL
jgi:hypothetical protein